MSKAILVIDMPESCENCPVRFVSYCNAKKAPNKISDSRNKPQWCPLREVPQKHTIHCTDTTHHRHVKEGWNYCIDAILKEGAE